MGFCNKRPKIELVLETFESLLDETLTGVQETGTLEWPRAVTDETLAKFRVWASRVAVLLPTYHQETWSSYTAALAGPEEDQPTPALLPTWSDQWYLELQARRWAELKAPVADPSVAKWLPFITTEMALLAPPMPAAYHESSATSAGPSHAAIALSTGLAEWATRIPPCMKALVEKWRSEHLKWGRRKILAAFIRFAVEDRDSAKTIWFELCAQDPKIRSLTDCSSAPTFFAAASKYAKQLMILLDPLPGKKTMSFSEGCTKLVGDELCPVKCGSLDATQRACAQTSIARMGRTTHPVNFYKINCLSSS